MNEWMDCQIKCILATAGLNCTLLGSGSKVCLQWSWLDWDWAVRSYRLALRLALLLWWSCFYSLPILLPTEKAGNAMWCNAMLRICITLYEKVEYSLNESFLSLLLLLKTLVLSLCGLILGSSVVIQKREQPQALRFWFIYLLLQGGLWEQ